MSSSDPRLSFRVVLSTTNRPAFESTPGGTLQIHAGGVSILAGALPALDEIGRLQAFSGDFSASLGRGMEGSRCAT